MQTLLSAADQGDWDQITKLSEQFLPALAAVSKQDFLSNAPEVDRKEIQHLLTTLRSAIEQCAIRQKQIAPLISAFAPAKDTPGKS